MVTLMKDKHASWTGNPSEVEDWMIDLVKNEMEWWFSDKSLNKDITDLVLEIVTA